MIKLYYNPYSRAARVRWLLEELGLKYELARMSFDNGDLETPAFLKLHPLGMVPALVDGDTKMFESAAMLIYLADRYTEKRLAPPISDSRARAEYLQWMFFGMSELEPPLVDVFLHTERYDEADRDPMALLRARERFAERAKVVADHLSGRPYMMGREFSAVDVLFGSMLNWGMGMGMLEGRDVLSKYVQGLSERPAFQAAQEE